MKKAILNNKFEIKYTKFENKYTTYKGEEVVERYFVTGIGDKAIKYQLNDEEEPKFAFHDSPEGFYLSSIILKSFDNEVWNEEVRTKIKAQKKYCEEQKAPMFAPDDGFCFSCHHQIYNSISLERASSELITGCRVCMRSYCD